MQNEPNKPDSLPDQPEESLGLEPHSVLLIAGFVFLATAAKSDLSNTTTMILGGIAFVFFVSSTFVKFGRRKGPTGADH